MKRLYPKIFICVLLLLAVAGVGNANIAYAEADTVPKLTGVIDLTNTATDCTGQGWSWDAQKKVWTLSGIDLTNVEQAKVLVLLPADTVIHLKVGSTNKITSNAERLILTNGDLTIEGSGRLILDANNNSEHQALRVLGNLTIKDTNLEMYNCGDGIACQWPNEIDDGWRVGNKPGEYGNVSIINSNIYMDNALGGILSDENQRIDRSSIKINNSLYWGMFSIDGKIECDQAEVSINRTYYGIVTAAATMNDSKININQQDENGSAIYMISRNIRDPLTPKRSLVIDGGNVQIQSEGYGIDLEDYQQLDIRNAEVSVEADNYAVMAIIGKDIPGEKKIQIANSSVQLEAPVSIMVAQRKVDGSKRDIYDVIWIADDMHFETTYAFRLFEVKTGNIWGNEMYLYTLLPKDISLGDYLYDEDDLAPGLRIVRSIEGKCGLKLAPKNAGSTKEKKAITIYVDGQPIMIDTANEGSIYIDENGRTIVPLRALVEALGIIVLWDSEKQTITIPDGPKGTVVFTIGSKEYSIDGIVKRMDTQAISLPPGRTHVPLRFVAESLGAQVEMSSEADGTAKIMITTGK